MRCFREVRLKSVAAPATVSDDKASYYTHWRKLGRRGSGGFTSQDTCLYMLYTYPFRREEEENVAELCPSLPRGAFIFNSMQFERSKQLIKKIIFVTLIIISFLTFTACSEQVRMINNGREATAKLLVSKDFGSSTIQDENAKVIQGDRVLDLMGRYLKVDTQYGGGFIKSINQVSSGSINGQRYDWFYYVNGVASDCSAKDYKVRENDRIHWDYHPWADNSIIPAIVGAYPEPFINGFNGQTKGTMILYAGNCKAEADKLAVRLKNKGAENLVIGSLSENSVTKRVNPTIIIGQWKDLETQKEIKEICSAQIKSGIYINFSSSKFELLDAKGKPVEIHNKDVSAIVATGSGLGDTKPLFIVTSVDYKGIEQAVDLLVKNPEKIRGYYGAAIINGEVKRLPAGRGLFCKVF